MLAVAFAADALEGRPFDTDCVGVLASSLSALWTSDSPSSPLLPTSLYVVLDRDVLCARVVVARFRWGRLVAS